MKPKRNAHQSDLTWKQSQRYCLVLCFHFSEVLFENTAWVHYFSWTCRNYQNLRCKKTTLCFIRRRWLGKFQVSPIIFSVLLFCNLPLWKHDSISISTILPSYLLDVFSFIGIDVGDQFYSRAEMVVFCIHSHWLNGIDYMGMKYKEMVMSIKISIRIVTYLYSYNYLS